MLILTPMHGRKPKSAKAAKADLDAELDFRIENYGHPYAGKPCNKQQCAGETVELKYRWTDGGGFSPGWMAGVVVKVPA